jgi:hypothetical protein
MSGPAGPGLKAAIRKIKGAAAYETRMLPYFRGPRGRRCANDIIAQVASDGAATVRDLVMRAGLRLIFIAEAAGQTDAA